MCGGEEGAVGGLSSLVDRVVWFWSEVVWGCDDSISSGSVSRPFLWKSMVETSEGGESNNGSREKMELRV